MRPSIQLNSDRLKYYRTERGFTLAKLAKAVHLTLRRYQRIEADDSTSPETAKRLATVLEVTLENLRSPDPISKEDTAIDMVWVESQPFALWGRLTGLSTGLGELGTWLGHAAKRLQQEPDSTELPKLVVRVGTEGIELRSHLPSRSASDPIRKLREIFVLRAATKERHGVTWKSFKQHDLDWLATHVWLAAGNCANTVEFNGKDLPQTDDCTFAITLQDESSIDLDYGPPEPDFQIFKREADLRRALRKLTATAEVTSGSASRPLQCTATDEWSIRLRNLPGRLSRKYVEICIVEQLHDGKVRRAPWPMLDRKRLASAIESNAPIIVLQDDDPDAAFAPNLLASNALLSWEEQFQIAFGIADLGTRQDKKTRTRRDKVAQRRSPLR